MVLTGMSGGERVIQRGRQSRGRETRGAMIAKHVAPRGPSVLSRPVTGHRARARLIGSGQLPRVRLVEFLAFLTVEDNFVVVAPLFRLFRLFRLFPVVPKMLFLQTLERLELLMEVETLLQLSLGLLIGRLVLGMNRASYLKKSRRTFFILLMNCLEVKVDIILKF